MIRVNIADNKNLQKRHKNYWLPILKKRLEAIIFILEEIKKKGKINKPSDVYIYLEQLSFRKISSKNSCVAQLNALNTPNLQTFFSEYLEVLKIIKNNLENVLVGDLNQLELINSKVNGFVGGYYKKRWDRSIKWYMNFINERIIPYNEFGGKDNVWNAYKLTNGLEVKVCPYCNINYTLTVSVNKQGIIRPDFDHYYCKKRFPYLALSFNNLVPACKICNSLKGDKIFSQHDNIHPFFNDYSSLYSFSAQAKFLDFINNGKKLSKSITLKPKSGASVKSIDNNIKVFKLIEIYRHHKELAQEIYERIDFYQNSDLDSIFNIFSGIVDKKDLKANIYNFLFKNSLNQSDHHKKPLSKFTNDISEEAGFNEYQDKVEAHLKKLI